VSFTLSGYSIFFFEQPVYCGHHFLWSLVILLALLLVACVLKCKLVADLQVTCMHFLAIDDRFLPPLAFVFSRISFFVSLGCILPSNVCGNLSQLSLPC